MTNRKVAIIGAGPAGVAAAVQLKRSGFKPHLFEKCGRAGGLIENAVLIENFPTAQSGISGAEFVNILQSWLNRFEIEVIQKEITSIEKNDANCFNLYSESNKKIGGEFGHVIIATGTSPIKIENENLKRLEGQKVFYEIVRLTEVLSPKRVCVIGSGDAAFDYALNLSTRFNAVIDILIRGDNNKALPLLAEKAKANKNIEIHYRTQVKDAAENSAGELTLVLSSHEERFEHRCEALLCAVGRKSNLYKLAKDTAEGDVGLSGETKISGLYAVGDVRRKRKRQLTIAVGDGIAAAMTIAEKVNDNGK